MYMYNSDRSPVNCSHLLLCVFAVIVVSLTAGILVVILTCALLMLQKQRPPLMMKGQDEMELCQPLKHCQQTALSQETLGAAVRLARLDEFSCISATLGPRST